MTAITSRGRYLPPYRVSTSTIRDVHSGGSDGVKTKVVQAKDDDAAVLAVNAARDTVDGYAGDVDSLYFATTTPVYAYGSVAPFLVEALGLGERTETASYAGTPRAATAALRAARDAVSARGVTALVVAADAPTPDPGTDREKTAGAGAAGLLLEPDGSGLVPAGDGACTRDLLEEWEAPGGERRSADDRFARDVGYVETTVRGVRAAIEDAGWTAEDVDALVVNHPNPKFPGRIARALGTPEGALVDPSFAGEHGDLGSASAPAILSTADLEVGDRVLCCTYGAGTADALAFRVDGRPPEPAGESEREPTELSYLESLMHAGNL